MSVTTVARQAATPKAKKPAVWRCQFCAQGHHRSCPRATRHNGKLWLCQCLSGQDQHSGMYCLDCKHNRADELHNWACLDEHACAVRRQQRNDRNPIWRKIQAAKVHGALERKAKSMGAVAILAQIDPYQDDTIERMETLLATLNGLSRDKQPKKPRKPPKPRATSGKCECCGEPTRGGRFLPGHDAKLVSALVQRIRTNNDREAYDEMIRRGWEKKIPAALRSMTTVAS